MFRIGVVGGSGFVGSALVKGLSGLFDVKVIDVVEPRVDASFCFERVDVRDFEGLKRALRDVDLVIHLAIIQIPRVNDDRALGYEVNVLGTENVCRAVDSIDNVKGLILASSWHAACSIEEAEPRAKLYVMSKVLQELIVRFYNSFSRKTYCIVRTGTILGEGMSEKTAVNIFIDRGLRGETITPYRSSMNRLMFYVDIRDVVEAYRILASKILSGEIEKSYDEPLMVNVFYPKPVTILEIAEMVRESIYEATEFKVNPKIKIIEGSPLNTDMNVNCMLSVKQSMSLLGVKEFKSPRESIADLVCLRVKRCRGE